MFRAGAALNQNAVQELLLALEKGDVPKVRNMLESGWRLEASQALYSYLTRMEEPLIPLTIQSLVLGGNDDGYNFAVSLFSINKKDRLVFHFKGFFSLTLVNSNCLDIDSLFPSGL